MKKAGFYLILASITYLIGQLVWFLTLIFDKPIFGDEIFEIILLILIYTLFGIFGFISGIKLYKN